jgi:DNA replication protein DnaC
LLIDDICSVRRDDQESSVLFELICHRYERRSLLITANLPGVNYVGGRVDSCELLPI